MEVFEFYFNPRSKNDLIFDSFCYEPENIYEKRLGSLYMAGVLTNVLPQNVHFLDKLSQTIKDRYYKTISATSEKSLKETLRKANEYLEKIAKGGDVSWLGNLSFAVIASTPHQKSGGGELNFTKVGDFKIFLLRRGQIIDIDQKLKFEGIEPYPLKIFGSVVSGKLAENDIILVLSKEIVPVFQEGLLAEIASISPFDKKRLGEEDKSSSSPFAMARLKEIFNRKKEELSKISGICLLIVLSKELTKEKEVFLPKKTLKIFSFKEIFSPLTKAFKPPKVSIKLKAPRINKFKIAQLALPSLKFNLPRPRLKIWPLFSNKKMVLILTLIFFLALGSFIFERQEKKQLKEYQAQLSQIQDKVNRAETYLIIAKSNPQAEKKANSLFRESWEEISPFVNISSSFPSDFAGQVLALKNNISENLSQINKLKIIEEPELLFEFQPKEFVPQKMVSFKESLYFFSPFSENIFEVNENPPAGGGEGKILAVGKIFNLATPLTDSLLFFSKPNQLTSFKDGSFQGLASLQPPSPDFNFNNLSSYQSNLYFLDSENGEIIKYSRIENGRWDLPQSWLKDKKAKDFKSLAVDGSVWILTKDNSIEKYYTGSLQETLRLEIFPYPKTITKIFTSSQLPYLYFLEPGQSRIIILNKSGQIIKQYQSEKFDNLLDFTISQDGKIIYLLSGLKVYQIKL